MVVGLSCNLGLNITNSASIIMTDRGEKIVKLAREIMRSAPMAATPANIEAPSPAIPIKAICMAAFLAAFGGSAVTAWIDAQRRPITHYERVELKALLLYAAQNNAHDETSLRHVMQQQLALANLDDLSFADYVRVRDYLRGNIP